MLASVVFLLKVIRDGDGASGGVVWRGGRGVRLGEGSGLRGEWGDWSMPLE